MQPSSQASSLPDPAKPNAPAFTPQRVNRQVAESLDRFCERGILGLVLSILVLGPLCFGAVDVLPILVIQGMTLGVIALWITRLWAGKSFRLLWPPVCWVVGLFVAYAIARYRMVINQGGIEYLARQELILVIIYCFLFLAILNNLSRQESIQAISITLFSLGTVLSLYALYQFLAKSGRVWWTPQYSTYLGRGSGTYICPNHLAGLLEMILPLALAYTLTGRFKPTAKVFLGYASVAIFTGIGVTLSRGAWIATGLALVVFFGMLMRQRGQRLAAIIFFVLLLGGFGFFLKNLAALQRRIHVVFNEGQVNDTRFELWKPAVQMWKDHFWWGVGPAHFDHAFRAYRPDDIQMDPLYAHNDYLNTLADWGLVGTILILASVAVLYFGVWQSWKFLLRANDIAAKRSNRSAFVLGASAGLFAMLLHSVVDFSMHIPANAIVAVTLMALIAGHMRFATERYWFKLGTITKPIVTLVCLAGVVYLGQQGGRRFCEYLALERAGRATENAAKLAQLKRAYALESSNSETTYTIGETLRLMSWQGVGSWKEQATEALDWFERGMKLNRFDPYSYAHFGMCLDWLDRQKEATGYFEKALALDPRNYVLQGLVGWHWLEAGNLLEAKRWYEKAVFQAHWHPDPQFKRYETGRFYLNLITNKLGEASSGQ